MPPAAARTNYNHLRLAPMKCHRPRLQKNTIIRGFNEIPSAEDPTKYHSTSAPTKFYWPSHPQSTIDLGSYSIMSAAARIKCRRPWLLRIIVHTIIYFKQNNGRLSETSILGDNFRVVFGPIAHLGRHWHGSLQPEMYAPCVIWVFDMVALARTPQQILCKMARSARCMRPMAVVMMSNVPIEYEINIIISAILDV